MSFDEVHDVPVSHVLRYDRKPWGLQHDTQKWKNIVVLKPLPSDGFFCKELRFSHEQLFGCPYEQIIYLVCLLVCCSGHPQGFYRHSTPIDPCLVHVRKTAGSEWLSFTFIERLLQYKRLRKNAKGSAQPAQELLAPPSFPPV